MFQDSEFARIKNNLMSAWGCSGILSLKLRLANMTVTESLLFSHWIPLFDPSGSLTILLPLL